MTHKMFCFCTAVALLCAFAMVNVASAQGGMSGNYEPGPTPTADPIAACPCAVSTAPCGCACSTWFRGCPPVTYRVGLFGHIRPVVYTPVYRPVYVPRYVCPPPYVIPSRAVYGPCYW